MAGLIGRLVRVGPNVAESVVSKQLMRIVPRSRKDAGYLFAVLSSPHGYRCITRHASGTSTPQLDPKVIEAIRIPWPTKEVREQIAAPVLEGWRLAHHAITAEREAIALVERTIEEAS